MRFYFHDFALWCILVLQDRSFWINLLLVQVVTKCGSKLLNYIILSDNDAQINLQ